LPQSSDTAASNVARFSEAPTSPVTRRETSRRAIEPLKALENV
jgi:hypothetical protein